MFHRLRTVIAIYVYVDETRCIPLEFHLREFVDCYIALLLSSVLFSLSGAPFVQRRLHWNLFSIIPPPFWISSTRDSLSRHECIWNYQSNERTRGSINDISILSSTKSLSADVTRIGGFSIETVRWACPRQCYCHTIHVSQSISVFLKTNDKRGIQRGKRIREQTSTTTRWYRTCRDRCRFFFTSFFPPLPDGNCDLSSGDRFSSAVLLRLHFSLLLYTHTHALTHARTTITYLPNPSFFRDFTLSWRETLLFFFFFLPNRVRRKSFDVHSARKIDVIPHQELKTALSLLLNTVVDWNSLEFYRSRNDQWVPFPRFHPLPRWEVIWSSTKPTANLIRCKSMATSRNLIVHFFQKRIRNFFNRKILRHRDISFVSWICILLFFLHYQ